jgi:hypothetical protein
MARTLPDQVASGELQPEIDRLRANLPRVRTEGLDLFERMIETMPDPDHRREALALVREERAHRAGSL